MVKSDDKKRKPAGFDSSDRLLKRREFLALTRYGRKVQDGSFLIFYRSGLQDRPRLGITVSKRVGKAVIRNRLKRLIREFFRRNRQVLGGNPDINVIAKPAAARLSTQEVEAALDRFFSKIRQGNH